MSENTVTRLSQVNGKALAAKITEDRKKREWQFKQSGAKTSEGVVALPNGKIRGMIDGED